MRVSARGEGPGVPPASIFDPPRWWKIVCAVLVALLIQAALGPLVTLRGAAPALVLLVVVWYGLRTNVALGLLAGTLAGVCEDALAGWTGAAWTISTGLAGALAGRTAGLAPSESRAGVAIFVALATIGRYAVFTLTLRAEDRSLTLPATHFHGLLWQSAFDAVLAFAMLALFPRLEVSRVGFR